MTAALAHSRPFPPGMPVRSGDVIADKYVVEGLVAVGGMGVVVSARHLQLGQQVAIKVLLPSEADDAGQAIARFLREARAAAGLKSDHVVRIYDVGTLDSGLPYMVMELLAGDDLRRIVKLRGALAVEDAVEFVLQAADAISEAHTLGIVHRDLKPSNLFLSRRSDGKPLVKVLDFGISKASRDPMLEGALTTTRAMIGSPMYMSPEQVRDAKSVDGRSDIWSLGVILYELLAAKPVFPGDSLGAICAAIAADEPTPLRSIRPDVPPELEAIVMRCLEKLPGRRFQRVEELRAALSPWSSGAIGFIPTVPAPGDGPQSAARPLAMIAPRQAWPSHVTIDRDSDPGAATVQYPATPAVGPPPLSVPGSATASGAPLSVAGTSAVAAPRSRLPLVLAALGLLLAVCVVSVLALVLGRTPKPAAAASAPAATSFTLGIDSVPGGAEVFEGDRSLGKTPFELEVAAESVKTKPRMFTLRLAGHQSYMLEQGPSDADVRVRAELVALPEPPPASADVDVADLAPQPTAKPNRGGKAPKPSTHEDTPGNTPKPGTDIRLSR